MGRSASVTRSRAVDRWPLVGRSDELALARDRITAGGSVVIAGDAGVGKTRLARELIESAEDEGRPSEWAVATYAARPIPFGAVAHLVAAEAVDGREPALRGAMDSFARRGDGDFVLGVDDAHLLDGVSAVLVHQLVSRDIASVVVTVRSGEPVPDPILGLWKDELAVRVELQPLARTEVADLLMAVLDGPMDGASQQMLWQMSNGNALFLRELVLQGLEAGSLREDNGLWHWDGSVEPGQRLRDVVVSRLGTLDDEERDALEVLAVGEPVPVDCLPDLFPPSIVPRLERRGLVRARSEASAVQVRLAHPLFGEVVRAGAPTLRSNEIRRRLADAFQAHPDFGPENALRVATWRGEIGDRSDPQVLVAGALARAGLADSARHVLIRARQGAGVDVDPKKELVGNEAVVRAILGDFDETVRLIEEYLVANPEHWKGFAKYTGPWWRDQRLQTNPKFKALIAGAR